MFAGWRRSRVTRSINKMDSVATTTRASWLRPLKGSLRSHGHPRLERALIWLVVPSAIVLLTWSPWQFPLTSNNSIDISSAAGLQMATHQGLSFGTQVVWNYGPLGFLETPWPWWFGHLGQLAVAYTLLLRFATVLAIFVVSRQTFGGLAAFVISLATGALAVAGQTPEPVLFLIVAVWALLGNLERRQVITVAVGLAVFAAMEALNKVSIGFCLIALAVLFISALPAWPIRAAAAALGAFTIAILGLWLALGQSLAAFPDYIENSARLSSGYAASESLGVPGVKVFLAAFACLGFGIWAALYSSREAGWRQRAGLVLMWIVFWFFAFKESFERADTTHLQVFFYAMPAGLLAFGWNNRHRLVTAVAIGAFVIASLGATHTALDARFDLVSNARVSLRELAPLISPSRRETLITKQRAWVVRSEPIDGASLRLLRGHTVEVYPYNLAQAWAYRLDWQPFPVLQTYLALTSGLDHVDARFVASARAPQRLIVEPAPGFGGRVLQFDAPQMMREILCRYRPLRVTNTLAIFALGSNRCSRIRPLGRVAANWGQDVAVPRPPSKNSLVFVRIGGVGVSGLERLVGALYEPPKRYVRLNRGVFQRLVPSTAGDGLPLRAGAMADFPYPYNIAPNARTIAVTKQGFDHHAGTPITYSFYAQSVGAWK